MTTKEKLDLLWKYLLLLVLVFGFYQLSTSHKSKCTPHSMGSMNMNACSSGHEGMMWFGGDDAEEMDIKVEIEKISDSDSTMVITINGEIMDLTNMDLDDLDLGDAKMMIKKLKGPHKGPKTVKIITKEVEEK